jgi:hypothetical protein
MAARKSRAATLTDVTRLEPKAEDPRELADRLYELYLGLSTRAAHEPASFFRLSSRLMRLVLSDPSHGDAFDGLAILRAAPSNARRLR